MRPFETSRFQSGLEPEIQLYCKPTEAKKLTAFIKRLTGISQGMEHADFLLLVEKTIDWGIQSSGNAYFVYSIEIVDDAPSFEDQLDAFVSWLVEQDLIEKSTGEKLGHWSMCSWSDADVDMIRREAERKGRSFSVTVDVFNLFRLRRVST